MIQSSNYEELNKSCHMSRSWPKKLISSSTYHLQMMTHHPNPCERQNLQRWSYMCRELGEKPCKKQPNLPNLLPLLTIITIALTWWPTMMIALTSKWQSILFLDFSGKILMANMKKENGEAWGHWIINVVLPPPRWQNALGSGVGATTIPNNQTRWLMNDWTCWLRLLDKWLNTWQLTNAIMKGRCWLTVVKLDYYMPRDGQMTNSKNAIWSKDLANYKVKKLICKVLRYHRWLRQERRLSKSVWLRGHKDNNYHNRKPFW